MFEKAKRKITLSIIAILTALLVITLAVIYISSYLSVQKENFDYLKRSGEIHYNKLIGNEDEGKTSTSHHGDQTQEGKEKDKEAEEKKDKEKGKDKKEQGSNSFSEPFFCVSIDKNGDAAIMEEHYSETYTTEFLTDLAVQVKDQTKGTANGLLYYVTKGEEYQVVTFMDNSAFSNSFSKLFKNTLLYGAIALICVYFLSRYLAGRIIKPMEEGYQKEKEFTADAGHELKTPIASIGANAELLRREIGENKWLDNIIFENERMSSLTKELLDLAQSESGQYNTESVDLSNLLEGCVLPLEAIAFDRGVEINLDIQDDLTVEGNRNQLQQLITILLDNAITYCSTDAIDSGGTFKTYKALADVDVSLTQSNGKARISVSNPGEPIPKEEQDKMFQRFYRNDDARSYSGHYGLGLAIAKSIVTNHNGEIFMECKDGRVAFITELPIKVK